MLKGLQPNQVKKYSKSELNVLCDEIRSTIFETVTRCGGHLASNLGAVESTVALFYTFDFPKDKINTRRILPRIQRTHRIRKTLQPRFCTHGN